ncbi:MAG: malto-oligosyltrehalose trehalohydrolase [Chloroflexi bacterium]|nr:malto-oligosyltrehalose trehalohydrolase [Chloroflexota bacterium]
MRNNAWRLPFGAEVGEGGTIFRVWAPAARSVEVALTTTAGHGYQPLGPTGEGVFSGLAAGVGPGSLYKFRLDGAAEYPDPYSRSQPQGVHGPSAVVDPGSYEWHDAGWRGPFPEGQVIYEVHVGTYTPNGTCDDLIDELPELARLGVTALQIMPLNEFSGRWNWGYDGVDLFAPSRNYGGPEGFKRLVDAAHQQGLGIILDVVYSHLGPEGNYLRNFAPDYFTDRYATPWGEALNFDGDNSRWVREYVVQNACYWLNEYHVDGLRLDATHAIFDSSRPHVLAELAERGRASLPPGRQVLFLAEDNRNEVGLIRDRESGGWGLDMIYADDFHHELIVLLTGQRDGYYVDYYGQPDNIAQTIKEGFLYQGERSPFFRAPRGTPTADEPAWQFLFCLQNHDQVGNRALGERLNQLVGRQQYLVAAALLLLVPETPLLFMGQEFAASSPFLYFTDHSPDLGRLVTEGRRREFHGFAAFADPEAARRMPDPQAEGTFLQSKLDLGERRRHGGVYRLHGDLLALRRRDPVLGYNERRDLQAAALSESVLALRFWRAEEQRLVLVNFSNPAQFRFSQDELLAELPEGQRYLIWSSADPRYGTAPTQAPLGLRLPDELRLPAWSVIVLGPEGALAPQGAPGR